MSCIVSSIACCFFTAPASLCSACLPSCRSSTSSRLMFSLLLIITLLLSVVALIPQVRSGLSKIPALCTPFKVAGMDTKVHSGLDCDVITGFGAVYRLCFASSMFFLLFAVLMIRVRSSQDIRSKIQNGFWCPKYSIWFLLLIGAFFIPVEGFTQSWMIIGMIGGVLYILVQLILLVDFAHSWNESWIAAYEDTSEKCYAVGLVGCTILFYVVSLTGVGLLFHYYAGAPECTVNKALLSLNLIACVFISVLSMLPKVRAHLATSGLLQASIISLYVIFLTWSAMTNGTDPACNPLLPKNSSDTGALPLEEQHAEIRFSWNIAFGLIVLIFSIVYSTIRTSTHTAVNTLTGVESTTLPTSSSGPPEKQERGQTVWDDEEDAVTYSYSMFHFMLLLATLYAMVTMTYWYSPVNNFKALGPNVASYWVRMVSTWLCMCVYSWTLIAPIVLQDRDF